MDKYSQVKYSCMQDIHAVSHIILHNDVQACIMHKTQSQTHRNQQKNKTIITKKTTSNTATIATTTIPARAPVDSSVDGDPTFTSVNPTLFNTPVLACVRKIGFKISNKNFKLIVVN